MDFSKLKEMLTGIPSDPTARAEMEKKNKKIIADDMGAMEARQTGRAMTPDEEVANNNFQRMVEDAGNNAGFIGSIGNTAKQAAPAGMELVNRIQEKLRSGNRLSAAEQHLVNKAQINAGTKPAGSPTIVRRIGDTDTKAITDTISEEMAKKRLEEQIRIKNILKDI